MQYNGAFIPPPHIFLAVTGNGNDLSLQLISSEHIFGGFIHLNHCVTVAADVPPSVLGG